MTPQIAARLVTLYPGRWRARYGDEFTHVLVDQPLTLRLLVDVIGGAVDAYLYRASAVTRTSEGGSMASLLMKRCATGGSRLTPRETWFATAVMLGSAVALAVAIIWMRATLGDSPLVDAAATMAFPALMIAVMPLYMKGATRRAKFVTTSTCLAFLAGVTYLSTLI